MRGLLIHNLEKSSYEHIELRRAAKAAQIALDDLYTLDSFERSNYDFTINRHYIAAMSDKQCGATYNDLYHGMFWRDKEHQATCLHTSLPIPKTIIDHAPDFWKLVNALGVPFVAKRAIASQGKGVFLVKNYDDFLATSGCTIFQEMIWETEGTDLRLWVLGGEIIGAMKRQSADGFKANIHQGAKAVRFEITPELSKYAYEIYQATGLDIIGVDLLFGKDGYLLCEINVNPGFEGLDSCHDKKTADFVIDYIKVKKTASRERISC